jgi:hypothetical protein
MVEYKSSSVGAEQEIYCGNCDDVADQIELQVKEIEEKFNKWEWHVEYFHSDECPGGTLCKPNEWETMAKNGVPNQTLQFIMENF